MTEDMRWLDGIIDSMDMNLSKLQKIVEDGGTWHAAVQQVSYCYYLKKKSLKNFDSISNLININIRVPE